MQAVSSKKVVDVQLNENNDSVVEKEKVVELGYENVVGQDSLTRFENKNSARRKKKRKNFSNTNRTP